MSVIKFQNLPNAQQCEKSTLPSLGLVCITSDKQVRFRTMTRTRYLKLSLSDRESALSELYRHNLQRLHDALSFCQLNKIQLYRMSSAIFPLSDLDDEIGANILEAMSADLATIGQRANALSITIPLPIYEGSTPVETV